MKCLRKAVSHLILFCVLITGVIGAHLITVKAETGTVYDKVKVACVGDSITYGHGSTNPEVDSYPAHLQELLGLRYEVRNFGVSGKTMNDARGWDSYVSTNEYAASKEYQPDIVILMLGTNDAKDDNWESEKRYEDSARTLIQSYQQLESTPVIYVATSPAVADDEQMKELDEPQGNYIWNSRIKGTIVPLQKKIAVDMGCRLIDINSKTEGLENLNEYLSWDLIHPHDRGYEMLAEWMYEELDVYRETGLLPCADTNLQTWQNERYYNYGGQSFLQLQRDPGSEGMGEGESEEWNYDCKIGFLKYDLSKAGLTDPEKKIEKAVLSVCYLGKYAGNAQKDRLRAVVTAPDWQEGQGTGNDAAEGDLTGVNQPEFYYNAADWENTSVVSDEFETDEGTKIIELDVTSLIEKFREEYPEETYISFAINETETGNRLHIGSREAGGGYGARLYLVFEEKAETDKTALNLVIAMAEKLEAEQSETGCYTDETWAAVQTALDVARALAENEEASQEDVDNAFLELITAVNLLENAVQKVALQTAIEGARAILAEEEALADYTPESVENLRTVLAEAENVYALESADQETVNAAARSLMDAVTSLVVIDKDTRLDILIQKAEELLASADQYTAASVENLQAALEAAQLVADDRDASKDEINAAYSALAEVMTSMVRKADKSELKTALDKAAEILADTSKYVEESVAGLPAAADAAQAVYDQEDADTATVGEAVKSLVDEILKARLMGDVDGNGAVDSADSAEVLRAAAEAQTLDEMQSLAADVNGDGASDSSDAAEILLYAAEGSTGF